MARDVLQYFVRNPQAVDSLEGVARWRLMDEIVRRTVDETRTSIGWLVERGYLTRNVAADGVSTFQLNAARIREAEAFLNESPAPRPTSDANPR
jgi:hypothetical protein